ncbi:MAG: hypothetical protein F6K58_27155 [Symploca sp. SIO2E9]|nr:hypothetical protein [Symploca sp. SIO2E9]
MGGWGDGETRRWGDAEMGGWGDGETRRWLGEMNFVPSASCYICTTGSV